MTSLIAVKHNIEVAHRLYENKGKCEQIHGHSMWVTLFLEGRVNSKGYLEGIEYGELKKQFRKFLDAEYDHRLLLNAKDPWSRPVQLDHRGDKETLPGLHRMPADPTTENIAYWIHQRFMGEYPVHHVEVWETSVNMASYGR